VPTTDGRIHVLDVRFTEGVNPDGTPIPKLKFPPNNDELSQ
jgi:hypothetical protein